MNNRQLLLGDEALALGSRELYDFMDSNPQYREELEAAAARRFGYAFAH